MFDKFFEKFLPEDEEEIEEIGEKTPAKEFLDDIKHMKQYFYLAIIVGIIVSTFLSGSIYQAFITVFTGKPIYIFSSFKFGITKTLLLTLLILFIILFGSYRVFRSLKKDYLMNYKDNYMKSKKETYGGAHFQTVEEMTKENKDGHSNFTLNDTIGETTGHIFGLTPDDKVATFNYPPGMNLNKIYFGAPGSGKSAATIKTDMYQAMIRGDSLVVTDTKGDLYSQTVAVARTMKYKIRVLNLKVSEFRNSDGFNLFSTLHADDVNLDAKADTIASIIMENTSDREADNYWYPNEYNLIKCLSMYVATAPEQIRSGNNSLPGMLNFLSSSTKASLSETFLSMKDCPMKTCYQIFAEANEKNQESIKNGVEIRLTKLTNEYLQRVLRENEIDPIEPLKRKCLYYVIISDTDDSYKFLSSLFFSTMFNEQCDYSDKLTREEKANQKTLYYLLDEYYASGGIYKLDKKIATLRSRKIGLTIILQDLGQLQTMYTEDIASTILNCCTIKGLLSTNDIATAEYFSTLLGDQTVVSEANRYLESSADLIHAHSTIQKTMSENKRALMLPEELMNGKLDRNEIIYVISGMPPVKLKKCFAEKGGVRIHPLEIKSGELGEKKPHLHKPLWRKLDEDREAERLAKIEQIRLETAPKMAELEAAAEQSASEQAAGANQAVTEDEYINYLMGNAVPQQEDTVSSNAPAQAPVNNSAEAPTSATKTVTKKKYVLDAVSKPEEDKTKQKENKPSSAPQSDMAPELTVTVTAVDWDQEDIMR